MNQFLDAATMYHKTCDGDVPLGSVRSQLASVVALNTTWQNEEYYMSVNGTTFLPGFSNGSPIDPATGTVTAPIYMSVFEPPEGRSFIYNFFLFYNYNGCSNEQVVLNESDKKQKPLDFTICTAGVHECDWESVQVEVCGDLSRVVDVVYNAHEWSTVRQCGTLKPFFFKKIVFCCAL